MRYDLSSTAAKEYPVFSISAPYGGINTDLDERLLPAGLFPSASGIRRHNGVPTVRGGSVARTASAVLASGEWKGVWSGRLNNVDTLAAAIRASSATHIVVSTDAGATWSEVSNPGTTAADDMFGNTRFATDAEVTFCPVHCPYTDRDVLIIQNGTDDVRLYDPLATHGSATNSCKMAKHKPITPPKQTGKARVSWRLHYDSAEIGNGTDAIASGSANITVSEPGTTPEVYLQAVVATTVVATNAFTITPSAQLICERSKQAIIFLESSDSAWLDYFTIEILGSDSLYKTVWDPQASAPMPFVKAEYDRISNKVFLAFPIEHFGITSFGTWRFTYVHGVALSAAITIKVYGLYSSGCVPAGADFAIAFHNTYSRATSPGLVLPNEFDSYTGHPTGAGNTFLKGAKVPNRAGLFYYPVIRFVMPDSTAISEGVDTLQIFIREDGTDAYRLLEGKYAIAEYSAGAWGAVSGFTAGDEESIGYTTSRIWQPEEDDYEDSFSDLVTRPSAFHVPIPIGGAMASASGRLFVAETASTSSARPRVMISENKNPFRFMLIAVDEIDEPSDSDALSFMAPGETFQRFEPVADAANNAVIAISDIWTRVFTGVSAFRLSQPTVLARVGTRSPNALCAHDADLYFVDDTMRLRSGSTFRDISNLRCRNIFKNVPVSRKDSIVAVSHEDLVYFGVTPSGGSTNGSVLVYDPQDDLFVAFDDLPSTVSMEYGLSAYDSSVGRQRLLIFSSDAKVYEYDSDDLDGDLGGDGIDVSLASRQINFNLTDWFTVKRSRLVCDTVDGKTATITCEFSAGGSLTGTVDLSHSQPTLSRFAVNGAATGDLQGNTLQVTLSTSVPRNTKLLALFVELIGSRAQDDV